MGGGPYPDGWEVKEGRWGFPPYADSDGEVEDGDDRGLCCCISPRM